MVLTWCLCCLWYLYWWIFSQLHQFPFLITQIQCLADHNIAEIQLYLENKNNYHNIIINLVEYGYHYIIDYLVFIMYYISPATPVYTSHDSDSVSWWWQNSKKMALASKIRIISIICYSHLVEYGYHCPIETFLVLWVNICLGTSISTSCSSN